MPSQKRQRKREGHQMRKEAMRAAQRRAALRRRVVAVVVVAGLVLGVTAIVSAIQGGGDDETAATTTSSPTSTAPGTTIPPVAAGASITGDTPCPAADGSSPRTSSFAQPPPMCIDPGKTYTAIFDTSEGMIEVALDAKGTPGTVNNFVVLSRYHYYDGSAIHRTDPSIDIIQGGSPSTQSASDPGPGYTIEDEKCPPCSYTEGDLVMARTDAPNSAGAQYFFVTGPNASGLDAQGTYVIFGKVATGLDVVKAILALHEPTGDLGGRPSRPVIVQTLTIREG